MSVSFSNELYEEPIAIDEQLRTIRKARVRKILKERGLNQVVETLDSNSVKVCTQGKSTGQGSNSYLCSIASTYFVVCISAWSQCLAESRQYRSLIAIIFHLPSTKTFNTLHLNKKWYHIAGIFRWTGKYYHHFRHDKKLIVSR